VLSLIALVAGVQALVNPLHQKRGGGSDVCSNVGCSVSFDNPYSGKPQGFGGYDQCTCLSAIPSLINSNSVLHSAATVFGNSKVSNWLTDKVRKEGKTCNYPDHSTPKCSPKNPCDFDCTDGYTAQGDKCVCKSPYKECNGMCQQASACPSKTPHKRDVDEWKHNARCDNSYTACGVLWSSRLTRDAYECVDTKNDLESCGGCSIPLHRGSPLGTDCTSLPGVADVSCMKGSCYVHKCMPGYELATDHSMCMDEDTIKKFSAIAEFGLEWFSSVRIN